MSQEITRLSSEKSATEAKLEHVVSVVKRYSDDRRKKKRASKSDEDLLSSRLRESERECREIYQFIQDLFPEFSNGQPVSRENAKSILVSVAKCLK